MNIADRMMSAIIFGEVPTKKKLSYVLHIPIVDKSVTTEVPVLVEMIHPNGGKIMVPNTKLKDIFALGLSVRSKYE